MARATDPQLRAAAIADLAIGMGPVEVADKHGVPLETVKSWKKRGKVPRPVAPARDTEPVAEVETAAPDLHPAAPTMHPVKKDLGEQLYDYLSESLETLRSQIIFARDEAWLRKQSASDVAILHGVMADKTTRLLAAVQRADGEPGPGGA